MDVTCERCGTEYDFDDALVSERGTTVKCTNCGAQFRVYRPVPATGPERWVVRTVDGRELVFSALRELQAAISTGVVGRDDVLSRGAARPRRLGAIAELEPFFKQAIVVAATSTAPGLGLPSARPADSGAGWSSRSSQRQEVSQAIPLPRDPSQANAWGTSEPPRRSGTLPPPPPVLNGADPGRARMSDPVNTALSGSMQPTSVQAATSGRLQNLVAADLAEPATIPRSDLRQSGDRTPAVPIGPLPHTSAAPQVVASRAALSDATIAEDRSAFADTMAALGETATAVDSAVVHEHLAIDVPPAARRPEESGVVERRTGPLTPLPPPEPPPRRSSPPLEGRMRSASVPPITPMTPTPPAAESRGSLIPEEAPSMAQPRFSMVQSQKRNSSVRWIVGVVLVGATALLAVTMGRKYLVAPSPAQSSAPAADDRVAKLLDDGDKSLRAGDLEGAKEAFDKASALAESDPQVVMHLAHLAVIRADQRWLKVRLVGQGAELPIAQAELSEAIEKMKRSVEAAHKVAPSDAAVRRYRVDALRIAGDRAGARALVAEMQAAGKTAEDDLTLAALDLAEDKPAWPTVIERLRSSVATDGNLGRARAMLVYALAASGDLAGARAEHDKLKAQTPPHPLAAALLTFMNSADGRPAATTTPTASGAPKGTAAPATSGAASGASAGSNAGSSGASGANSGASTGAGPKPPGGRVSDDYVAPNAGTVDISDMGGHSPPAQTAPPAPKEPAPAPPPTSDLPGN
ncbi:MAG: zinc-ribbon domain-containing protein [Polyangiaceae bacterium]